MSCRLCRGVLVAMLVVGCCSWTRGFSRTSSGSLADIVARVLDGVVNIQTRDVTSQPSSLTNVEKFFESFLLPGLGSGQRPRSLGSGFFYPDRSHIVTNYHVIKDAVDIMIVPAGQGRQVLASVVGIDERGDLAVLRLAPLGSAIPLRFGMTSGLRIGDEVFAIGNPFGFGHTLTRGILSAKGRTIGAGPFNDFLQTDAVINPGNSGGPLFNMQGEVIGMNTAVSLEGYGISFAIPSEMVKRRADEIIASGRVQRPWLGVIAVDLNPSTERDNEVYGVHVDNVVKNSPADRAGLQPGDVIMAANGIRLKNTADLQGVLNQIAEKSAVQLSVFRGKVVKVSVTSGLLPNEKAKQQFAGSL